MDKRFKILYWDTKKFGYKVASVCFRQLSGSDLGGSLATSHYVPFHSLPAGRMFEKTWGDMKIT